MNNSRVANLLSKFKTGSTKDRIKFVFGMIAGLIALLFACSYLVGSIMKQELLDYLFGFEAYKETNPIIVGFTSKNCVFTFGIFGIIVFFLLVMILRTSHQNEVELVDDKGVAFMKNGIYGTSRFATPEEIKKDFEVTNVKNTTSTIYGQLTSGGKEVVAYKKRENAPEGTRNDLMLANMGSGKTYTYVYNELIQTVRRGDSFVVSDPKGEIFNKLCMYAKNNGYETHLLNTVNPEYSEFWDCLQETISLETERVDKGRLDRFVKVFMKNTGTKGATEDFWYNSALNLINAIIGLVAFKHEEEVIDGFIELYTKITGNNDDENISRFKDTLIPFPECRKIILDAAERKNYDIQEVESLLHDIQYVYPRQKYDIETVFNYVMYFNRYEYQFFQIVGAYNGDKNNLPKLKDITIPQNKKEMEQHPAWLSYLMFITQSKEDVRSSALQGAQLRFQIFANRTITRMLSRPGINIRNINKKKTAIFICISDNSDVYDAIASLFFSFFFQDCMQNYDEEEQRILKEGGKNRCLPVTAMLEEFSSLGVIGGTPDTFQRVMSTCRSRKLYVKIILQSIVQLEINYGEKIAKVIESACSTKLFLGASDMTTAQYISSYSGDATVLSESHIEVNGRNGSGGQSSVSASKTMLITPKQALDWEEKYILVFPSRRNAMKLRSFPITEHPAYINGELIPISMWNYIEPMSKRIEEEATIISSLTDKKIEKHKKDRIESLMVNIADDTTDNLVFDENGEVINPDSVELSSFASKREDVSKGEYNLFLRTYYNETAEEKNNKQEKESNHTSSTVPDAALEIDQTNVEIKNSSNTGRTTQTQPQQKENKKRISRLAQ